MEVHFVTGTVSVFVSGRGIKMLLKTHIWGLPCSLLNAVLFYVMGIFGPSCQSPALVWTEVSLSQGEPGLDSASLCSPGIDELGVIMGRDEALLVL